MESQLPQFGTERPGVNYVLRPGGYVVLLEDEALVACVAISAGLALPGGAQEKGETPAEAARREAAEECGLLLAIGPKIAGADEWVFADDEGIYYRKHCEFFSAEVVGYCPASEPDHRLTWVKAEVAAAELIFESQRWAVTQALKRLGNQCSVQP